MLSKRFQLQYKITEQSCKLNHLLTEKNSIYAELSRLLRFEFIFVDLVQLMY